MKEVRPPIQPTDSIIPSLIRTYVPIIVGTIVGQIAGFLATKGLELDPETQKALSAFLGGFISIVYYFIARKLERKHPSLGKFLLGSSAQPTYIER